MNKTVINHDDVQPSEAVGNGFDELIASPRIGDVRFDGDTIHATGLQVAERMLRSNFVGAIRDGDASAVLRQPRSKPPSDASAATRYQRYSIAKRHSSPRQNLFERFSV